MDFVDKAPQSNPSTPSRRSKSRGNSIINENDDNNGLNTFELAPSALSAVFASEDHGSLFVVDHDMELNAYVSNAITEEEMGGGIVIGHIDRNEIVNEEYGYDKQDMKELTQIQAVIEENLPVTLIDDIYKEEVLPIDSEKVKSALDATYEFYNDKEVMADLLSTLNVDVDVKEGIPTLADLSTKECQNKNVSDATKVVYDKYKCLSVGSGGPINLKKLASAYILQEEIDDSFYIFDIGNVQRLYDAWHTAMPRVTPFYAVKCSPMPAVIDCLAANGCGFDCASAAEIQLVLDAGVHPENIIFAHPAKRPHDIRFAAAKDVKLTTFDSVVELEKIAKWHPNSDCVLRIKADDPNAGISFGIKYGANPDEYEDLYGAAKRLGLNVSGISFHVGSLARSGQAFYNAIKQARVAFDASLAFGFKFRLLDLGGGFTGRFNSNGVVQSMAGDIPASINEALNEFFGEDSPFFGIRVIAEPGRYFAEASMHLLCHVHSVRNRVSGGVDCCDYCISDGLYGSFNCVVYDGAKPRAWLMPGPNMPKLGDTMIRSTVFGPTCDSMDCVFKDVMLPQLRVGDWLLFPHFGAYTLAGATNFNGIQSACPKILYVESSSSVDEEESLIMWACEMTKAPSAIVAV